MVSGSTEPAPQVHPSAMRILERQPALRARIEHARRGSQASSDEIRTVWTPEIERIERVILKNARGHAFFEYGEALLSPPTHVRFMPLLDLSGDQLTAFEAVPGNGLFPEVGSRMLTRVLTGQDLDGPWVIVQDDVYRYADTQVGTMLVRSLRRKYIGTRTHTSRA